MLRRTLLMVHAFEILLYSWIYSLTGGGWWVWLSTLLVIGLGLRAVIIFMTLLLARVPLTPLGTTAAAYAAEFYSAVRLYSYDAIIGSPEVLEPAAPAPNPPPPLLFIHGFMCNAGFWRQYMRYFSRHWHNSIATLNLEPLHAGIDEYSEQIDNGINELLSATGADSCLIVAHSMGGLAVRSYFRNLQGHAKVTGVVTLGTPHSGTTLAQWSLARNSRQMRRFSRWLEKLDAAEADAPHPPFEALIGTHDNIVAPQKCAAYRFAANTYMFGVTHLAMALNEQVIEWTHTRLLRLANREKQ